APLAAGLELALAAGAPEGLAAALAGAAGLDAAPGLDAGAAPPPQAASSRARTGAYRWSFKIVVLLPYLERSYVDELSPGGFVSSGRRFPDEQAVLDGREAQVDDDDDHRQDEHSGEDAGAVEGAFGELDHVAQAFGSSEVFAHDGADEGEADGGVQAGEDPHDG